MLDIFVDTRKKVTQLTDRTGRAVDAGILNSVTILQLYGLSTVGSCEGHLDRITGGPYIMFESPVQDYKAIDNKTSPAYAEAYRVAEKANIREVQKVLELLDGFYAHREVLNAQRLIVRCFSVATCKLMCQGADLAHILSHRDQEELLQKNQAEMKAFTSYLIGRYEKTPDAQRRQGLGGTSETV